MGACTGLALFGEGGAEAGAEEGVEPEKEGVAASAAERVVLALTDMRHPLMHMPSPLETNTSWSACQYTRRKPSQTDMAAQGVYNGFEPRGPAGGQEHGGCKESNGISLEAALGRGDASSPATGKRRGRGGTFCSR